ncbi:unnamed protein product [Urochloa decumbens]|uniref:Uncharacterized protein n=1 Tax=Urochloa decumbens TaxID=240449 RepID=A0ABC9CNI9_9POAL
MDSWEEEARRFLLNEEDEDDELFLVMVPALQLCLYDEKRPEHTSSLPSAKKVKEILEGHEKRREDDYSIQKCIDIVDAMEDLTDEQKADANDLFQSEVNR